MEASRRLRLTDQHIRVYCNKNITESLSDLTESLVPRTVHCSVRSRPLLTPQAATYFAIVTILCM
jgi:cell division protein ZapA (FtsZ GTPase activity inhibitor)